MSYQTYTTKALVCGSKDSNTADRAYLLFTEQAGMLWATARSVRTEQSKQRYALQDFSLLRVSLVKGKGGWRVGSVEALGNSFLQARNRYERAQVQLIVRTLRRLIHGEEAVATVFRDTVTALDLIGQIPSEQLTTWYLFRTLQHLGYIAGGPEPTLSFREVVTKELPARSDRTIEQALAASHL